MFKRLVFLLFLACVNAAEAVEWETLIENGDWRLDVNLYDDGSLSCEALSLDAAVASVSFLEWQDGTTSISFSDRAWSFPEEAVATTFLVQIDRQAPWNLSGSRSGASIRLVSADRDQTSRFFHEVRNGRRLVLMNERRQEIRSFSLNGSAAILEGLGVCRERILTADPRDPFAARGAGAADPFL